MKWLFTLHRVLSPPTGITSFLSSFPIKALLYSYTTGQNTLMIKWQHNAARNFLRSSVVSWENALIHKNILFVSLWRIEITVHYRGCSNHFQLWRCQTAMGCPLEPPAVPTLAPSIPGATWLALKPPIPPSPSPHAASLTGSGSSITWTGTYPGL